MTIGPTPAVLPDVLAADAEAALVLATPDVVVAATSLDVITVADDDDVVSTPAPDELNTLDDSTVELLSVFVFVFFVFVFVLVLVLVFFVFVLVVVDEVRRPEDEVKGVEEERAPDVEVIGMPVMGDTAVAEMAEPARRAWRSARCSKGEGKDVS